MDKVYSTILSLTISCFVTYSLIVPTSHVFGLEDSTAVNSLVDASDPPQSATTTEQTSKDNTQEIVTRSNSEPQKVDDPKSEQGSTEQSEQTTKDSSSTDRTPPGRVGTVTVKIISSSQIDLKWTGVKDSDLHHYNVFMGTKSSFKVTPGVTVPGGGRLQQIPILLPV